MDNHTKEPWKVDNEGDYVFAINALTGHGGAGGHWKHIALIAANEEGSVAVNPEEAEDNAERIVACVNACEGISTEALNAGAVAVLLSACESILEATEGSARERPELHRARCVLANAVALAIGEKKVGD